MMVALTDPGVAAAAAAAAAGNVGAMAEPRPWTLLALPDSMLLEVMGNLGVKSLGRASCACRGLRDATADEGLWMALWEGPFPGGFDCGGKAAHAALWLLAKGEAEQTRVAVYDPASPTRTATRRRVGYTDGGGGGRGGGEGPAVGGGGGMGRGLGVAVAASFPVHVSCMTISGGTIATATGPEITVWNLEEVAPRARFIVSGHGSVTCLLLRQGTLLAGDNSGYLRCYDVSAAGGSPLHEIRTHAGRVTGIDAFSLPSGRTTGSGSGAGCSGGGGGGGGGSGALQTRCWDQGHGWGEGWLEASGEEGGVDFPSPLAVAAAVAAAGGRGREVGAPVGVGRGCGRGHGQQGLGSSRSSGVSLHSSSAGFGNGGGNGSRIGGFVGSSSSSRLGKRQDYAGRGQGCEPMDAPATAGETGWGWWRGRKGAEEKKEGQQGGKRVEEEGGENEDAERLPWGGRAGRPAKSRGRGGVAGGTRAAASHTGAAATLLFTGSDDGTAKAWDAVSGRFVRVYAGHTRGVTCLQAAFTQSYGPILVTGGGDSAVVIWELATGRCLEKLETGVGLATNPGGAGPRVGCLQAYRNSIVVGEDRHVSVWHLDRGKRPRLARARFCEHQRPIRRLELVGRWIVTCSGDYMIRLWDSKTGECVRELGTKSGAAIMSFRLSGVCLLSTSLFDATVLMTSFLPRRPPLST